jgi:hypothetical protein
MASYCNAIESIWFVSVGTEKNFFKHRLWARSL